VSRGIDQTDNRRIALGFQQICHFRQFLGELVKIILALHVVRSRLRHVHLRCRRLGQGAVRIPARAKTSACITPPSTTPCLCDGRGGKTLSRNPELEFSGFGMGRCNHPIGLGKNGKAAAWQYGSRAC